MDKKTRAGIIALGAIAIVAAIAAVALYEEDENQRISKLWEDAHRQARRTGRELSKRTEDLSWVPHRGPIERIKDSAAEAYEFALQKKHDLIDN